MKIILKSIYLFTRKLFGYTLSKEYYKSLKLSIIEKDFIKQLSFFKNKVSKSEGILLVQLVRDYEFTIKLAASCKVISDYENLKVNFYDVRWTQWIGWGNEYDKLYDVKHKSQIENIYCSFGENIIFRNQDKFNNQNFVKNKLEEILIQLKTPNDILIIKFDDILVGDLIYDSYLRYFSKPTITEIDDDLINIIEIGLNIFYNFNLFLKRNNVKALLNTYATYLEHGLTARICLGKKIDVYVIGSYDFVIRKLTKDFFYESIDHTLFDKDKYISEEYLNLAKNTFTSRFKGVIDNATRYMRFSAYSERGQASVLKELFQLKKRNIVIYVHDFYDAPHINRCLLHNDLFQFLKQTLDYVQNLTDTSVFIKTHPNGILDCKQRTIDLVNNYNKDFFHIVDDNISNLDIVDLKPNLIVTARGTIGAEMAYFEIPVVALYDNIYVNFDFVHSCRDLEVFYRIISGVEDVEIDFNKEKIYSFYYQAYLEKNNIINNCFNKLIYNDIPANSDEYFQQLIIDDFSNWKVDILDTYKLAFENLKNEK